MSLLANVLDDAWLLGMHALLAIQFNSIQFIHSLSPKDMQNTNVYKINKRINKQAGDSWRVQNISDSKFSE